MNATKFKMSNVLETWPVNCLLLIDTWYYDNYFTVKTLFVERPSSIRFKDGNGFLHKSQNNEGIFEDVCIKTPGGGDIVSKAYELKYNAAVTQQQAMQKAKFWWSLIKGQEKVNKYKWFIVIKKCHWSWLVLNCIQSFDFFHCKSREKTNRSSNFTSSVSVLKPNQVPQWTSLQL